MNNKNQEKHICIHFLHLSFLRFYYLPLSIGDK